MECTALVVYDDWHKMQSRQRLQMMPRCRVAIVSVEQLERLSDWVDRITDAVRRAADALTELFKQLFDMVMPTLKDVVASLKRLFDSLDLDGYDDNDVSLQKRQNRLDYLHTKRCIAQKRYYSNQFKLVSMHVCIVNHIKR